MRKTQKLGIIGVGHVGTKVLVDILNERLFGEIVLIDTRQDKILGEAMDEMHATGLPSSYHAHIYAGDYADLADADMIIITATHMYDREEIGLDRQTLLIDNMPMLHEVMTGIQAVTEDAILMFISNPVDTIAHLAVSVYGYPAERVIATGTMLDSSRLRYAVAKHYGIDPKSVTGFMLGEHGVSAFAAISHLNVFGIPFDRLGDHFPGVAPLDIDQLNQEVVDCANDVFLYKKGVTDAAIARVASELARTIMLDEQTILPLGVYHETGIYACDQPITFSVPTVVGRQGVVKHFAVPLNEWETRKMHESIEIIQHSIAIGKQTLQQIIAEENEG